MILLCRMRLQSDGPHPTELRVALPDVESIRSQFRLLLPGRVSADTLPNEANIRLRAFQRFFVQLLYGYSLIANEFYDGESEVYGSLFDPGQLATMLDRSHAVGRYYPTRHRRP